MKKNGFRNTEILYTLLLLGVLQKRETTFVDAVYSTNDIRNRKDHFDILSYGRQESDYEWERMSNSNKDKIEEFIGVFTLFLL